MGGTVLFATTFWTIPVFQEFTWINGGDRHNRPVRSTKKHGMDNGEAGQAGSGRLQGKKKMISAGC